MLAPKRNGRRLVLEMVTWPLKSIYNGRGAERSGAGRRAPHDQQQDFGNDTARSCPSAAQIALPRRLAKATAAVARDVTITDRQ